MLNKVQLIGYVGKDAEVRKCQNGSDMMTFSVATSESYKDKNGEYKSLTTWHNVKLFNVTDYVRNNICKGRLVYIEGKLRTDSYTTSRNESRTVTYVNATDIKLLDKSPDKSLPVGNKPEMSSNNSFINDDIPF